MIVIPLAGLSSRFSKAGYQKPKYELELDGKTVFSHSVLSFSRYFDKERFLFIALNRPNIEQFVNAECVSLNIINYEIILLEEPTKGQAETVYKGLCRSECQKDEPILIFNIDTFRPDFTYPEFVTDSDVMGYLETFIGSGSNWSNVVPDSIQPEQVALTAEKQNLSEYCCTGLYYWRSAEQYCELFKEYSQKAPGAMQGSEYYIAPMYNMLIEKGGNVRYTVIEGDKVIFCGTPQEYEALKNGE